MANVTEYQFSCEKTKREHQVKAYYHFVSRFNNIIWDSESDAYDIRLSNEEWILFDYYVENYGLFGNRIRYILKEKYYEVDLYTDLSIEDEESDFFRRYKIARIKSCLPIYYFRILLQTLFFNPVGWLQTKVGMDER